MGSIGAMSSGSANRYFQKSFRDKSKFVPEGVEVELNIKAMFQKLYINYKEALVLPWVILEPKI